MIASRWAPLHRLGDTSSWLVLFGAGLLAGALLEIGTLRAALIGAHHVEPWAALAVLAASSLLAWGSLAARRAVWMSAAELTWQDFDGHRVGVLRRRLWVAWLWRVGAVGYLWALSAGLVGASTTLVVAGSVVGAAVAVIALVALRPRRTAERAGRDALIAGWRRRTVRRMAVSFMDPLLLVTAGSAVGISLLGATVARFAILGVTGRSHHLLTAAALLLVAVALLQIAPALPAPMIFGGVGYLAVLPLAGALGELWRSPGLRRWIDATDTSLRLATAAVLTVPAALWLALAVPFGAPLIVLAVAPVVVAAVVRSVTRPGPGYGDAVADTPIGPVPVQLVAQAVRGPDLLAAGLVVIALGLGPVVTAPLLGAVVAAGALGRVSKSCRA